MRGGETLVLHNKKENWTAGKWEDGVTSSNWGLKGA